MAKTIAEHAVILTAESNGYVEGMKKGTAATMEFHRSQGKAAASFQAGSKAASKFGVVAQSAGYQVQDLFVQIAGGQNIANAISQQGSQFLGVFGPAGAIAGAVLAVAGLAYNLWSAGDKAKDAKEEVDKLAESFKKLGEARKDSFLKFADPAIQERSRQQDLTANQRKLTNANRELSAGQQIVQTAGGMGAGDAATLFPSEWQRKGYEKQKAQTGTADAADFGGKAFNRAAYLEEGLKRVKEAQKKINELTEENLKITDSITEARNKEADKAVSLNVAGIKKTLDLQLKSEQITKGNTAEEARKKGILFTQAEAIKDQLDGTRAIKREAKEIGMLTKEGLLTPLEAKQAVDNLVKSPTSIPSSMQVTAGASALGGTVGEGGAVLEAQRQIAKSAREQIDILRRMLQLWSTGSN